MTRRCCTPANCIAYKMGSRFSPIRGALRKILHLSMLTNSHNAILDIFTHKIQYNIFMIDKVKNCKKVFTFLLNVSFIIKIQIFYFRNETGWAKDKIVDFKNRIRFINNLKTITNRSNITSYKILLLVKR